MFFFAIVVAAEDIEGGMEERSGTGVGASPSILRLYTLKTAALRRSEYRIRVQYVMAQRGPLILRD